MPLEFRILCHMRTMRPLEEGARTSKWPAEAVKLPCKERNWGNITPTNSPCCYFAKTIVINSVVVLPRCRSLSFPYHRSMFSRCYIATWPHFHAPSHGLHQLTAHNFHNLAISKTKIWLNRPQIFFKLLAFVFGALPTAPSNDLAWSGHGCGFGTLPTGAKRFTVPDAKCGHEKRIMKMGSSKNIWQYLARCVIWGYCKENLRGDISLGFTRGSPCLLSLKSAAYCCMIHNWL